MKKNSGSAYGLTVVTGNHAMIKGRLYRTITEDEKPTGLDQDVTVEEDVWIGCHVTLLSGVTIGRGSIVAAGAVVTKSFPPYSIIGGVPAKLIKFKWDIDDIINHEMIIYPESERYSREELVAQIGSAILLNEFEIIPDSTKEKDNDSSNNIIICLI